MPHGILLSIGTYHHHHQFLTPAIWRQWIRMNGLYCPWSFVKSIAPLNVNPIDFMSSFIVYIVIHCLSIVVLVCLCFSYCTYANVQLTASMDAFHHPYLEIN